MSESQLLPEKGRENDTSKTQSHGLQTSSRRSQTGIKQRKMKMLQEQSSFTWTHASFTESVSPSQTYSSALSVLLLQAQSAFPDIWPTLWLIHLLVISMTKSRTHSSDTADSPCLLGNVPQRKRPGIKTWSEKQSSSLFFFITCLLLLLLLLLLFLLFTTSTHAPLLLTLVLSECVLACVRLCAILLHPPPLFYIVFDTFSRGMCRSLHSFLFLFPVLPLFQSGKLGAAQVVEAILCCHVTFSWQEEGKPEEQCKASPLKGARNSCSDQVHQHFPNVRDLDANAHEAVGVSLLTPSEKTKEVLAGFESSNCNPLHVADWAH